MVADGTWIAFTSGSERPRSVHVMHADGTDETVREGGTPTADGPPFDCWEVWAPDATELLAVCGPWTIIPMDGSEPRRLTIPPETATIDWQRIAP